MHPLKSFHLMGCLLIAATCFGAVGCGSGMARVEGKVTFDGEPVNRGMITFEPADGQGTSAGGNVENGQYSVEEVQPGPKLVRISAVKVVGMRREYEADPNSPTTEVTVDLLPERYNTKSELTLDVKAPVTEHNFELVSK
jgi:hypothetical protein